MSWKKFEYAMNAILYCHWVVYKKLGVKVDKVLDGFQNAILYLFPEKCRKKIDKNREESKIILDSFWNADNNGFNLILAKRLFCMEFIIYMYGIVFVISIIIQKVFNLVGWNNMLFNLSEAVVTLCVSNFLLEKAVLSNDKFLAYFKKFKKEDDEWWLKWRRNTRLFFWGMWAYLILCIASGFFILCGL